MEHATQNSPFVKQLASSDRHARDQALDSLRTYLAGRKGLDDQELMKLWKGLYYCMWMSDKRPVQQRLANDLAGLVDILPQETVLPFLEAFWKTMAREWTGIESLRMDKFLLLVRRYLHASFRFLSREEWRDTSSISRYVKILRKLPLNPENYTNKQGEDLRIPDGLRMHVADIYVDELDRVDEAREGYMPLETLLEPLRKLVKETRTKSIRTRAKEALEDERLKDWSGKGEAESKHAEAKETDPENEGAEWGGIEE